MKRQWLMAASALTALLMSFAVPTSALRPPRSVGVDTLLRQETDISTLPRFRDWTTHLQSSYQRNGGNGDAQNFLSYDGKTAVLADMQGAGAIVRLWSANPNGQLKIYIDDNPTPVIDMPFKKLFDGSLPPFVAPLAQASSGGVYSYIPIPYANHCRVTVDNPQGLYYQVNYVTYPAGTLVRPFALPITAGDQKALDAAVSLWNSPASALDSHNVSPPITVTIATGKTKQIAQYRGPGAIRLLQVNISGADDAALRKVILRAYFDGHQTPDIEAPVLDFFGDAYGRKPFSSLLLGQSADSMMEARFPMPFGKSARFTLENGASAPVNVTWSEATDARAFDPAREGYFHARWWQEITRNGVAHLWAKVRGQRGHFVGVVQTMNGPHGLGFLEGDDQVRVDGETWLPSEIKSTVVGPWNGTGTEDCFNSGWYFQTGPNALPVNGALVREDAGRINVYRWFLNDAPVFQKSLDAQIETGGVNNAPGVYYSSVAYWYSSGPAQPWAKTPKAAALTLPQAPPVPVLTLQNAVEGEDLLAGAVATGGKAQTQEMAGFEGLWSHHAQLFWTDTKIGDTLTLSLPAPQAGRYRVIGYFTQAADYGRVTFQLNGHLIGAEFDGYHNGVVSSGPVSLGTADLAAGNNPLIVTISGKNPASSGTLFGLDALVLQPIK